MLVRIEEGKIKDVAITEVTPDNYIVPENEKHLYHCIIEVKKFDSETGKRLSIPRVQKFGKKGYENDIADNLKKQGYTITVLHDPNEYIKAKAEEDERLREERRKNAAEEKEKARAAEKEALKNEILEELKAAGIIPATPAKGRKAKTEAETEGEK